MDLEQLELELNESRNRIDHFVLEQTRTVKGLSDSFSDILQKRNAQTESLNNKIAIQDGENKSNEQTAEKRRKEVDFWQKRNEQHLKKKTLFEERKVLAEQQQTNLTHKVSTVQSEVNSIVGSNLHDESDLVQNYEKYLGLKITTALGYNGISFCFTKIDPSNYDRIFEISIKVTDRNAYD
eukprot:Awhi_evm1s1956